MRIRMPAVPAQRGWSRGSGCGTPSPWTIIRARAHGSGPIRRLTTVRTFSPKAGDIERQWHVIDASDVVLGRLASQVAMLLRGKHKPIFAPHVDTGDFVIVVNAEKVALSGNKLRSEEHTSELQSQSNLVCRLL